MHRPLLRCAGLERQWNREPPSGIEAGEGELVCLGLNLGEGKNLSWNLETSGLLWLWMATALGLGLPWYLRW